VGLAVFGFPISEEFSETSAEGTFTCNTSSVIASSCTPTSCAL
jgi:hypothetical protein